MLGFPLAPRFDLLPAGRDFRAIARRCLAEDMRVATLQLVADGGADIVKVKASLFLRHLRIEHHRTADRPAHRADRQNLPAG